MGMLVAPARFGGSVASYVSQMHFEGTNGSTTFTDASGKTWTAVGNAQISTARSKFGSSSGIFDGTDDLITTPNTTDFDFGTGDFTLEVWIYLNVNNVRMCMWTKWENGNNGGLGFEISSTGKIVIQIQGSSTVLTAATTVTTGAWHHVAVTRAGTTMRVFLDGTQDASVSNSTNFTSTCKTSLGGLMWTANTALYRVNGNMDECRVIKGTAIYTSSFTPPAAPFTD